MSGLYVALDVEYDSDYRVIMAGPMAELLYVRGLVFCKRTMSDGAISRPQLVVIGRGIPSAAKHAATLVEVGLWVATETGWQVRAWAKRNKSSEEIKADRAARKAASVLANHRRWHLEPDGKPSASCPLCRPTADPTSDPISDPKPKPEPKGSQSHSQSHSQREREGKERTTITVSSNSAPDDAADGGGEFISIGDALRRPA